MNVVMIALDAVRADHLSCYGYPRSTSPRLDALAAGGVLFERHFTPITGTMPAMTTVFSGTHPLTHLILNQDASSGLNPKITWLSLLMRHHGIDAVAVDDLVDHRTWFARGYRYYLNPRRRGERTTAANVNDLAIEWIETGRDAPFFMHMHYPDAHAPYMPADDRMGLFYDADPTTTNVGSLDEFYRRPTGENWPKQWFGDLLQRWPSTSGQRIEDIDFIAAQYDAQVRAVDDAVGVLCDALERVGRLDDTLLIVYGNHGEQLGEHGVYFDAHGLHDASLHVPLILHWPSGLKGGRRVQALTQHQDLAATVVEAVGESLREDLIEGRSMLPLARGETTMSHWNHKLIACESTWQAAWALRTSEYKLIVSRECDYRSSPPVVLFDLLDDPGETRNIAAENPNLTKKLLDIFDGALRQMLAGRGHKSDPIVPGAVTLGRRLFQAQGHRYPPRPSTWNPHPPPRLEPVPKVTSRV
ncbi:MAG: hypothetical protein CMJ18_25640 [Phycisphaeraceae bacterium]|nr:hypothetical protein [Phycisphaeraceae bacterium]